MEMADIAVGFAFGFIIGAIFTLVIWIVDSSMNKDIRRIQQGR